MRNNNEDSFVLMKVLSRIIGDHNSAFLCIRWYRAIQSDMEIIKGMPSPFMIVLLSLKISVWISFV